MAINVTKCAAPDAGEEVALSSIWPDPEPVFLHEGSVYRCASTAVGGGSGYGSVVSLETGASSDLLLNASVRVAQSASLIVAF
jgi:hypothetical protein